MTALSRALHPQGLVVAAWEPELTPFRELCLEADRVLGASGPAPTILPVGIGLVDAALGTARAVSIHAPTWVVFIGTCGASPSSGLSVGDVVVAEAIRLVDPAVVEGRAAMPYGAGAVPLDPTWSLAARAAGARAVTVANTLGVTTDDALAAKLAEVGEVEHLESYGVARACESASIGCAIILGVANIVGARGREQWRTHHVAASARAAAVAHTAFRTSTTAPSPASR